VANGDSGNFRFPGVPVGDYVLRARVVQVAPNWQGGIAELATLPLTVTGDDVLDLVLHTTPAPVLTGEVVAENPSDGPLPALSIETIDTATGRSTQSRASREQAGRVIIPALWGHYVFRLQGPADWWLKSVMLDDREIIDSGVDLSPVTLAGELQIVITRQATTVSGSVVDDQGRPRAEYVVVAFSPDAARWTPGTRFIRATTSRPDGTFVLQGLPPGEYVLIAVPELEIGDETDPDLLEAWRAVGTRTSLAAFESKSVTLSLTR
jgi:hypothetical protein